MKNDKIILEDIQKLLVINSPQTTSLLNEVVDELENILQEEFTAEERNLVRFYVKEQVLDERFLYNLKRRFKNFVKTGKFGIGRGRTPNKRPPSKAKFIKKVFNFIRGSGFQGDEEAKEEAAKRRHTKSQQEYFRTPAGQETLRRHRAKRAGEAKNAAQLASSNPTEPTLPTNERELEQHFYSRARINGMGHSAATKAAREEMRRRESERIGNQQ